MTGPYGWAAQQLTECLVRLGECEDVPAAVRTGLDRAAETFEAEAGVVVREGSVVASRGFPASESPPADWGVSGAFVPGLGELPWVHSPVDGSWIALARAGEPFQQPLAAAERVHELERPDGLGEHLRHPAQQRRLRHAERLAGPRQGDPAAVER